MVSGELHASRGGRAVRTSIGSDGGYVAPPGRGGNSGHPACVRGSVCADGVVVGREWRGIRGVRPNEHKRT